MYHLLVDPLLDESHVFSAIGQDIFDNSFQECLGQGHVVAEIIESHFRLDHPELREMSGRVGILRSESWPKGIYLSEGAGEGFYLKLAAHGQVSWTMEEIFGV